ncbi:hypothetical protein HWV62_31700 [Athelia sp. TMB]|nr:hypothetical protein HWV62_31700 [Athelia sp. TMB]
MRSTSSPAPIDDCQALVGVLGACTVLATMATATLFFLRVRAVYLRSRAITAVVGALWLATLGIALLQASALDAGACSAPQSASLHSQRPPVQIAATDRCAPTANRFLQLPNIATTVSDTLVFLAITYRLAADAATDATLGARVRAVLRGRGLYSLSKALMQSGQRYYLCVPIHIRASIGTLILSSSASIVFSAANLAVWRAPGVPPALSFVFIPFYVGFTNMMAARVFRGVALELLEGPLGLTTTRIAAALHTDKAVELEPVDDTHTGRP